MWKYKRDFAGEFIGTFILVLFGCGSVAVSILFEAYNGIVQIAFTWGIGVSLAIYATRHLSCAHLNPAVTIAMIASKRMNIKKGPVYILAQFIGAFVAGIVIYGLFSSSIINYENANGFIRGTVESASVAKIFGEYYVINAGSAYINMGKAMVVEGFGTFILVFMIFALTEGCNLGRPDNNMAPIFIGLTVSSIICLLAPLTQGGFNPARDLGPRIVAWFFGWGNAAFPDQIGGFFFVYILSPIIGGLLASLFFTKFIQKLMEEPKEKCI